MMTPDDVRDAAIAVCGLAPVMPVVVLEESARAAELASALVAGGLRAIEVTLRTPSALESIAAIAAVPDAVVGAGTLITPEDVVAAKKAGARFGVSPGFTLDLLRAAREHDLPLIPGVASVSEAMQALQAGYSVQKFFPAATNGGPAALKAIGGPLPQIRFCPTGGVTPANAGEYLALPNVVCVGGSWVAPQAAIKAQDWAEITRLARDAAALRAA